MVFSTIIYKPSILRDRNEYGAEFDSLYHRVIFSKKMGDKLTLKGAEQVKTFLEGPFTYYTNLYVKLLKLRGEDNKENPFVYYNTEFTMRVGKGDSPYLG